MLFFFLLLKVIKASVLELLHYVMGCILCMFGQLVAFNEKKKLALLQELLIETLSNGRKSLFVCVFNLFEKIVANTFLSA